jgi:Na+-driven multidrug efflux pump
MTRFKRYFGDRRFYKNVILLTLPIMIQSGITNAVNMLDNLMIGSLGTEAISGVSIVNQLLFIFSMVIFGANAAVGIFTSQYHGAGDSENVKYTFRMKLMINFAIAAITVLTLLAFETGAISLFIHETNSSADLASTFEYGKIYLRIMLVGLVPYAISQTYASTLRECGDVKLPMYAGVFAIISNVVLNAILIFGLFGFPALGVAGLQ